MRSHGNNKGTGVAVTNYGYYGVLVEIKSRSKGEEDSDGGFQLKRTTTVALSPTTLNPPTPHPN
jgi:hypothetical protein